MHFTAADWIKHLNLQTHIEGGAYKEVYRSSVLLPPTALPPGITHHRAAATSIYFLLQQGDFSAFHRIRSDETWHFYAGSCLLIHEFDKTAGIKTWKLGPDPGSGQQFQCTIGAGNWFAAEPAPGTLFALTGCTVAPGFDFEDLELANRDTLIQEFPGQADLIKRLTR